ncbi:MAG: PHP domain-containing protein, partial [Nakamurella sp.]
PASMTIDLHAHSVFSDGTDTPGEVMACALAAGVTTVAIVDHDTTDGWATAEADRPDGVTLVRGAELSTHVVVDGRRFSIHLLAYLFSPSVTGIAVEMARLRADRLQRGLAIVGRMVDAGVPISAAQVLDIAGGAPVGRPHIGRALMERGLVGSVTEAFSSYLSARGPFYVSKADTPLDRAIALVRDAGGVPVIAHSRSRGAAAVTDEAFFARYAEAGLMGVEVDHPDHDAAARIDLRRIASKYRLIMTGSSDYHGTNKTVSIGQETTAAEELAAILAGASGGVGVLGPVR